MSVAVLILLISVVRYSRQQYPIGNQNYKSPVSSESATLKDYDLPHPGMLPDHSLYFIKMLRDRVKLVLVSDDVKKVNLLLFYADKRIGAAEALLRGGNISLAEVTAHKAELYMGQAMDILRDFNEEKKSENIDLWWIYYESVTTHKILLDEMALMVEGDARVSMEKVIKNCEMYRAEIMGQLEIEESEEDVVLDEVVIDDSENEMSDVEKGYL